jgi:inner membrane transporter RhtA
VLGAHRADHLISDQAAGRHEAARVRSAADDRSATGHRPAVPAIWLVLIGIVSVQIGSAVAKSLFDQLTPTALVWIRLLTSAVVLGLLARPRLRRRGRDEWVAVLAFGASLALMNWSIYQSFARIPIGIAVTIEFIGPLAVALLGSRRLRDALWGLLAAVGVLLLGLEPADLTPAGVGFALLAGTAWAMYILASARTGNLWPGIDGLAIASIVATLLVTPAALPSGGADLLDPRMLILGAVVGLLSSAVPYTLELLALRSMRPALFGVLMSLGPAAAALAGFVVLGELLAPVQAAAMACVVAASIGATRSHGTDKLGGPEEAILRG